MNKLTRRGISYSAGLLCTYVLAVATQTQFVLHQLTLLGIEMTPAIKSRAILADLKGMAPTYGVALALVLLLAFVSMSALRHRYRFQGKRLTYWVYPLASMIGVWGLILVLKGSFDLNIIAGARSDWGFFCQGLAGFAGGWVYMNMIKLLRRYAKRHKRPRHHQGQRGQSIRL